MTEPWVEAIAAEFPALNPRISADRRRIDLDTGASTVAVFEEAHDTVALAFSPNLDLGRVLEMRQRLPAGLSAAAERVDGRVALVTRTDVANRESSEIAAWAKETLLQFLAVLADALAGSDDLVAPIPVDSTSEPVGQPEPHDAMEPTQPMHLRVEYPEKSSDPSAWLTIDSAIAQRVVQKSADALRSYESDPLLIDEHANKELGTAQGGYGRRQVYELVQNAADELLATSGGMIKLLLTDDALYCANEGSELSIPGVNALLMSDLSVKRGNEIGRFGLGFKSVLAITPRPVFLSRSGSFRFDPDDAAARIRTIATDAERTPHLRTAIPIDPVEAANGDEILREMMAWATTVVKLPRDEEAAKWLHQDLIDFPAEFLLFSSHVARLIIEDRTTSLYREISVTKSNGQLTLTADGKSTAWSIFRRDHRPSPAAKADAGEISDREVVPVIWAVRQSGSQRRGEFWAFFPTSARTTLSGIINAPWKTNSDRQNLLPGDFNEELVNVVAELVVENLASLSSSEDPGRLLDILPARGRESPSWADQQITERVYELAVNLACLPDQTGALRLARDLNFPPAEIPIAIADAWTSSPGRPVDWLHPSASTTKERRSKAERLYEERESAATYQQWLEALTKVGTPEASISAIAISEACRQSDLRRHELVSVDAARILLTSTEKLAPLDSNQVFLYRDGAGSDLDRVHPAVQANEETLRILDSHGFRDVGQEDEYRDLVKQLALRFHDWEYFWKRTADLPADLALAVLNESDWLRRAVNFRTVSGGFHDRYSVLLPGGVVSEDEEETATVTIDVRFHEATMDVVRGLGIGSGPVHMGMEPEESWLNSYRHAVLDVYDENTKDLRQRPSRDYLEVDQKGGTGPLAQLKLLPDRARLRFTAQVLATKPDDRVWRVQHRTSGAYPPVVVPDPVSWYLEAFGLIPTSLGGRSVKEAVGPALHAVRALLPVAECSQEWASQLNLPSNAAEIAVPMWNVAIDAALLALPEDAAALYAEACRFRPRPDELRCSVGRSADTRSAETVYVTADRNEWDVALEAGTPIVFVTDQAAVEALISNWGLAALKGAVDISIEAVPIGEPITLGEAFPALRPTLGRQRARIELLRCEVLRQVAVGPGGRRETPVEFVNHDGRIYWLERDDDRALLEVLNREFDLGLEDLALDELLVAQAHDRRRARLAEIRETPDAPAKLLTAIGGEGIRQRLASTIIDGVEETEGRLDDLGIARLAAGIHGIDLFKEYKQELAEAGLGAPDRWAGSQAARLFVAEAGLPRAFAGYEDPRLDPLLEVEGPASLMPLHDFQEELTVRIRTLVAATDGKRALLSLPTGAGKTRVTVEALIRGIREDELGGPILWTAPTKELCEQAVQTWAYVWRAVGPIRRLHLSRLWDRNQIEEATDDGIQVVVATEEKVLAVKDRPDYEWLSRASLAVVDEAHGSLNTGYTQIFHWLGLGRDQVKDRIPLIGLTATPYKGINVEATDRLRKRYGSKRLDAGVLGDDPHRTLQEMRVLARAKQRVLGGSEIDLTPEQAERARHERRLPQEVEERLGEDRSRNRMIIDTILELDRTWKVIVFATSVAHAEQLSAVLNFSDVKSAVISANTNGMARRHYVHEFNHGDLRVLTNYGVLAEGFDAPSVRAVIVARPTLSPGVYQQMIGRGLRGPLNGGKDECLIVNVADNIVRYGLDLAFREFDYPAEA